MRRTRGVWHLRWRPWCRVPAEPHIARGPCLGTTLGSQHAQNARSAALALATVVQSASRATRCALALPRHPQDRSMCRTRGVRPLRWRSWCRAPAEPHNARGPCLGTTLGSQYAHSARSAALALAPVVQGASGATRCAWALPKHHPRIAACAERDECGTCAGARGARVPAEPHVARGPCLGTP